jgi:xanthine dehydrogenase accessory factor
MEPHSPTRIARAEGSPCCPPYTVAVQRRAFAKRTIDWRIAPVENVFDEIVKRASAGERVALCTVVATRGSTPQEKGARMLVLADGKTVGTLGGGCVEAEVRKRAIEMLSSNTSALMDFHLDHDFGWDDGLICGGVMEIYVQMIDRGSVGPFAEVLGAIRGKVPTILRLPYEQQGVQKEYAEEIGPPPKLIIAGAGHVGQALGELAVKLDFNVTAIDDRADYASKERFPGAKELIVGDIEAELRRFPIDAGTYLVIVTRGHRHDGQSLHAVIGSPAKYIGLIGSKAKIKLIFDDLAEKGVPAELLMRVHAPIGYNVGAVTVPEIAVSIAAELIAVRRGREKPAVAQMKLNEEELRGWLSRKK